MAFRTPLKIVDDGSDSFTLQNCTAAEIVIITNEMIRQYGANPSATLAVGTGNLGNITDTRLKAGAAGSDNTNFDTEAETADVATVTVTYNKLVGAFHGTSAPTHSSSNSWSHLFFSMLSDYNYSKCFGTTIYCCRYD